MLRNCQLFPVYSGSFNPLHIGHLAIMRHLTQNEDFDSVYLVVSPKNPLKDSIDGRLKRPQRPNRQDWTR